MTAKTRQTASRLLLLSALSLGLIACDSDNDNGTINDNSSSSAGENSGAGENNQGSNTPQNTVADFFAGLSLRAPNYSAGQWGSMRVEAGVPGDFIPGPSDQSDVGINSYDNQLYYIARYNMDYIMRAKASAPNEILLQNTTNDEGQSNSNPYQVVVESAERGYLIRYGSSTAWIINPMASTGEAFKIGEIDLSQLVPNANENDTNPEMHAAVIADGKLFIALQNLASFRPEVNASIAVFDLATQQLVDTDPSTPGVIDPISLPIENSGSLQLAANGQSLLVSGVGRYQRSDFEGNLLSEAEYTGGIASVNLTDYSSRLLIDDGDALNHPYGQISGLTVVDNDTAFFVGYEGFGQETLYPFNPETGAVGAPVAGYQQTDIGPLAVSPDGRLWIGMDQTSEQGGDTLTEHVIRILDADTLALLHTAKVPAVVNGIAFANASE